MTLPHQLVREIGDNSLGAAIEKWWHSFIKRGNLLNSHSGRCLGGLMVALLLLSQREMYEGHEGSGMYILQSFKFELRDSA